MTCRSKTSQSVLLNWLKVGAAVPNNLVTHPVLVSTANKVPALRPNRYAQLNTVARWRTSEWAVHGRILGAEFFWKLGRSC